MIPVELDSLSSTELIELTSVVLMICKTLRSSKEPGSHSLNMARLNIVRRVVLDGPMADPLYAIPILDKDAPPVACSGRCMELELECARCKFKKLAPNWSRDLRRLHLINGVQPTMPIVVGPGPEFALGCLHCGQDDFCKDKKKTNSHCTRSSNSARCRCAFSSDTASRLIISQRATREVSYVFHLKAC